MNKVSILMLVTGFLILAACNESTTEPNMKNNGEEDTSPPMITVNLSSSSDTISNEVTITANATDDNGIDRVEFFVDGENVNSDDSSPYMFDWQTLTYADTMEHEIFATAYDNSDNSTDSDVLNRVIKPYEISLSSDVQNIFDSRCVTCHGGNGGLFLTSGQVYSNLVNEESVGYAPMERVVPGKPDSSVLYLKVTGDDDVGTRMPANQEPLNDLQLAQIRFWILQGAEDN